MEVPGKDKGFWLLNSIKTKNDRILYNRVYKKHRGDDKKHKTEAVSVIFYSPTHHQ